MRKSKNCYKCKHFYKCYGENSIDCNLDKYVDKRMERKFMRECNFRYCKKYKFLKTFQQDNIDFINEENSIIANSLGVTCEPIKMVRR